MKDKQYLQLASLYGIFFLALGASSFTSVFLGGKGMDNSQIGLLMSVPPIISLLVQPAWGLAGDRARYKRSVLAVSFALTGIVCFMYECTNGVWPLMIVMCLHNCASQACSPISQTICMEYTADKKGGFGPIRMIGSITYQAMVLIIGFLLSGTMPQLFRIMGIIYVFCAAYALLSPPIEGHQHEEEKKVSPLILLKDKRIILLLAMIFCGRAASVFYVSFFNKYTQELFHSNSLMSILHYASLFLEIPFFLFSDKIMRKMKITTWALIGYAATSLRFIGISVTSSVPVLICLQLLAVVSMGCSEYFPMLYMNEIAPDELKGSMQSLNVVVTFGLPQIFGSMLGGVLADAIGLQSAFGVYGAFLVVMLFVFIIPVKKSNLTWAGAREKA